MVEYRIAATHEHEALIRILTHAFASDPSGYADFFKRAGYDNLRVASNDGEVVGTATLIKMGMFFGGRSVPTEGVAGVAVKADQMRRGIATSMMASLVRELGERGVALSALYASTVSLYRKGGYEAAGGRFLGTMLAREIPFAERELDVRGAGPADTEAVHALYRQSAASHPGFLDRGAYLWPRLTHERFGVPAHGLLVEADGVLEGYVYYRKVKGGAMDRHHLHVTDMVAATPRAVRRIWTCLRDLGTMLETVVIPTSPTDPFQLALPDPRHAVRLYDRWMLRIANLPAAIVCRGFPPGLRATLHLDVTDDVVAANAGRWVINVRDGAGVAERGGGGTVRITARGFASLYAGYASPASLAAIGQLDCEPEHYATLAAPFAGPVAWMRDHF
ncbi:MAG: GNAT family N-acetyltransferase [Myxococcota bacterium]